MQQTLTLNYAFVDSGLRKQVQMIDQPLSLFMEASCPLDPTILNSLPESNNKLRSELIQ